MVSAEYTEFEDVQKKNNYTDIQLEKIVLQLREVVDGDIRNYNEGTRRLIVMRNYDEIKSKEEYLSKHAILKWMFLEKKMQSKHKEIYSFNQHSSNYSELVDIIWKIYDVTKQNVVSGESILDLRKNFEEVYESKRNNLALDHVSNYLFQYPEYAKAEFEALTKKIRSEDGSYGIYIGKFYDYGKYYPALTEQLMKELGSMYNRTSESDRKRILSAATLGFVANFDSICEFRVEQLGDNFNWTKDKSCAYAGIICED
ncbi:MAG: hypothetical protein KJ583_05090 [Nanoarchaeota archaeon]|nr:hypothetical protein [Nanoarchaeota archaeon]MBU1270349.1 hypothetical protein [Nanoarchaeota archaeon]MBU1604664.1 hypothetical protein [Nanoarchaeota archaeon]MBU2443141.1 hypothetical protein [Nanoarchaeota archaeon]